MRRLFFLAALPVVGAVIFYPAAGTAVQDAKPTQKKDPPKSDAAKFAVPELAPLAFYLGAWNVKENHFDQAGRIVGTASGTEEVARILDRRAVRRTYTTADGSRVFRAIGIVTWNEAEKRLHGVWFDNASTNGPTTVMGEWIPKSRTMEWTVETVDDAGKPVRYKVVDRFDDVERHVATTYQIDAGSVIKRMEVLYTRSIPCPDRIRIVFDEEVVGINK